MKEVSNYAGVVALALILFLIMSTVTITACVLANGGHLSFATDSMTNLQTIALYVSMFSMSSISVALSNRIINGKWFMM